MEVSMLSLHLPEPVKAQEGAKGRHTRRPRPLTAPDHPCADDEHDPDAPEVEHHRYPYVGVHVERPAQDDGEKEQESNKTSHGNLLGRLGSACLPPL
jgi:hypothetical protein